MTDIVCVDVLDWAKEYGGPKFHALLCDPPYELGFMGKDWDQSGVAFQSETWAALAEHLHPGAFGMAFASARGWHRLAVAIEDAGLRIHPSIFGWSYGSGFPKATRIDTQVDKRGGAMPGFESFKAAVRKRMGETGVTRAELQRALGNYMLSHYLTDGVQPATPNWHDYQIIRDKLQMGNQWDGIFLPEEDREVVGQSDHKSGIGQGTSGHYTVGGTIAENYDITAPATLLAQAWQGHRYGLQALKPALEPIIVFQKPYQGKPVECITETGAGALWIDGGRIGTGEGDYNHPGNDGIEDTTQVYGQFANKNQSPPSSQGRWPANFVLVHHPECRRVGERRVRGAWSDKGYQQGTRHSDFGMGPQAVNKHTDPDGLETIAAWDCHESCPARRLGEQSGERASSGIFNRDLTAANNWTPTSGGCSDKMYSDTGTAARFFFQAAYNLEHADPVMYCAKASRKERDAGLEEFERRANDFQRETSGLNQDRPNREGRKPAISPRNSHPTVKPIALAQWLATLLLPPEEYAPRRLLIPFAGSGSEAIGAGLAGWDEMALIEMDPETCEIAEARLAHWLNEPRQLELHGA